MSAWRSGGVDPAKANAGLRGLGFLAIVIAFLAVSNGYVSQDDPEPSGTSGAQKPVVLAPEALRTILPVIAPNATYRFTDAARAVADAREGKGNVLVAGPDDARALAGESRCTDALEIATKAGDAYVACLVVNAKVSTSAGVDYVAAITSLKARAALLEAGFDIPER